MKRRKLVGKFRGKLLFHVGVSENTLRMLNKLTIETFDSISTQIAEVGIKNVEILQRVIKLLFDKAVSEPHFSRMYATLCQVM
jgi:translation initiation factor 4G